MTHSKSRKQLADKVVASNVRYNKKTAGMLYKRISEADPRPDISIELEAYLIEIEGPDKKYIIDYSCHPYYFLMWVGNAISIASDLTLNRHLTNINYLASLYKKKEPEFPDGGASMLHSVVAYFTDKNHFAKEGLISFSEECELVAMKLKEGAEKKALFYNLQDDQLGEMYMATDVSIQSLGAALCEHFDRQLFYRKEQKSMEGGNSP